MNISRDFDEGVQQALLRMIEGTVCFHSSFIIYHKFSSITVFQGAAVAFCVLVDQAFGLLVLLLLKLFSCACCGAAC
jgi:hypothetical protein